MRAIPLLILASFFISSFAWAQVSSPSPSPSPTNAQLEKRIHALEKRIGNTSASSEESDREVHSYLNTKLTLGGFFESAITSVAESNRPVQVSNNSNTFGFNIGAEFTDDLRFVSQFLTFLTIPLQNPNSDPRASGTLPNHAEFKTYSLNTLLTEGYLEWSGSELFNIQMGLGYAPFGIALQQYEPVLFVRRGGPQLLNDSDLLFPLWQGLHVHGAFPSQSNSRVGYDIYTFTPASNAETLGAGAHLWWKPTSENLAFGLSHQIKKVNSDTVDTLGADAKAKIGAFTFTSEVAKNYGQGKQPWSVYFEPDYDFHESFIVYVFGDYLDNPLSTTGALADPIKKWQYGTGVNWLPTSFTRIRLGLTFNQYVGDTAIASGQDRNYWGIDLSVGVAF
jgi:hypothetical protein